MTAQPFKTDGATFYTPPCLLRWPSVDKPRVNKLNPQKAPQYEATFVLSGSEMCVLDGQEMPWVAAFKKYIDGFCIKEYGRPVREMIQTLGEDSFVLPVKLNNTPKRAKHPGIKDLPQGVHFSAGTQFPLDVSALVDLHGRTLANGRVHEIYDGCMVIGAGSLYKWAHNSGKRGISCNLIGLQKVGDGPRLGGATATFDAQQGPVNAPGFDPSAHFAPQAGAADDGLPADDVAGDYPTPAAAQPAQPTQPAQPAQPAPTSGFTW